MASSKAMIPALCCLGLLCLSSPAIAGYDFFEFSLLWPGSYCNGWLWSWRCCRPDTPELPALDFIVEGLQPYDSTTGNPVTNCNPAGCKFYVNAVAKMIEDLYKYWSDVNCPSKNGRDLWKYAWCQYGNCTRFNQTTYFQKSLHLRANLKLLYRLAEHGITPSSDVLYNLSDIQEALMAEFGGPAIIECKKILWVIPVNEILRFKFCYSTDGKTRINCPIDSSSSCGEKVWFPPFTYDMLKVGGGYIANPSKLLSTNYIAM